MTGSEASTPSTARRLGLALSGGGSRAAAFHRGTLRALLRLGLLPRLDVVSSVSGGSVAASAWAAAGMTEGATRAFLGAFKQVLRKGFVTTALFDIHTPLALLPRHTLTLSIASAFDRLLLHGKTIQQLPEHPKVVLNVTVLNSGQVGKFTREGFGTFGLGQQQPGGSNPRLPMDGYPLSLATAASAAFPVGLKPVYLQRAQWFPEARLQGPLAGHDVLALSDGGIVENLGAQTLLRSRSLSTADLVVSDAGAHFQPWKPGNPFAWIRNFFIFGLSPTILERFMSVMNDKENRWMREVLFADSMASRVREEFEACKKQGIGGPPPKIPRVPSNLIDQLLDDLRAVAGRRLLLLRVDQRPDAFAAAVPEWRLEQLGVAEKAARPLTLPGLVDTVDEPWRRDLLREALESAQRMPASLDLNAVPTSFGAMSESVVDALDEQAYWQALAAYAVYWEAS